MINEHFMSPHEKAKENMVARVAEAMRARVSEIVRNSQWPPIPIYEEMARVAMLAMREPTDAMCGRGLDYNFPGNVWRAMLEEALRP